MNESAKVKLRAKLVDTCVHLEKTEQDKKASNAAFGEEIKGAKKRINAISTALKISEFHSLHGVLDEFELEALMKPE
jgi:hypothetical protein